MLTIKKPTFSNGFTLLEVTLALFIVGILSTSIILVTNTNLNLSRTILTSQEKDLKNDEVEDHIKRHLRDISRDSKLLLTRDESNHGMQTLSIIDPPHYFPFEGKDTLARRTDFIGNINSAGLADLFQNSFATKDDNDNDAGIIEDQEPPDKQIALIYDLIALEWYFYDNRTDEWMSEWDNNRIPRKIMLVYQKADESTARTTVFWLPTPLTN